MNQAICFRAVVIPCQPQERHWHSGFPERWGVDKLCVFLTG
jgi:hypothetical protein